LDDFSSPFTLYIGITQAPFGCTWTMVPTKRVLLFSNVEPGHSNTFLAVAHSLLLLDGDVEVHYASFGGLERRVQIISEQALRANLNARPIVFHRLDGVGLLEATLRRNPDTKDLYQLKLGAGFWDILKLTNYLTVTMMNPYTGPEYVAVLSSAIGIINTVKPDIVVFDNALPPAMAACVKTGILYKVNFMLLLIEAEHRCLE
jgi:hypothetical protein